MAQQQKSGRRCGLDDALALAAVAESALPLALSFGRWYLDLYCAALAIVLWYKGLTFVYPTGGVVEEMVLLVTFYALQRVRIFFGSQGWQAQRTPMILPFVWLAVPAACVIGYHINFQIYVVRIEVILCGIAFFLLEVEAILGVVIGVFITESALEKALLAIGLVLSLIATVVMVALHTPGGSDYRLV